VLVIGRLADPAGRRTGFPELRTESLALALAQGGCSVRIAGLVPGEEAAAQAAAPPRAWEGRIRVAEEGPGWLDQLAGLAEQAEVLVGAGPHNASRAACLVAGERPVWADVPGDPMAELQAVTRALGQPQPARQAAALAALLPVLHRADALGAVSERQRLVLLGQLGLVGRLEVDPPVAVVPVAWHFDLPPQAPAVRAPGSRLHLLLMGTANAWLDLDGTLSALQGALERLPRLQITVAGGPAVGHHAAAWTALCRWAKGRARVSVTGRLDPAALTRTLASAHATLVLDGPGLEPETGSRTRALFALHQGLEVLATTRTELGEELAREGAITGLPAGAPQAAVQALVHLFEAGSDGQRVARAQHRLAERYAAARVAAPVVAFAREPWRLPASADAMAGLAADHARLRDALARVHATPTWRLLSGLHRRLPGARKRG